MTAPPSGPRWLRLAMRFDGRQMRRGEALRIGAERITTLTNASDPPVEAAPSWESECIACPAFIDL